MDTRKAVKTYHRNLAIVLAIIVAIFAAIPLVVDKPYIINIFVLTFYMSTLSMAWNILGGITGQNSLGLAAYMGLGAYVCCLVVTKTGMNPWVAAVLDMLVVGVVAGVIFFPSLILRGPYFTLVSIAFAESIRQFIINSGLNQVGPAANFSALHPLSKIVLTFDMLAGRLELFPMLLLFAPETWRRNR